MPRPASNPARPLPPWTSVLAGYLHGRTRDAALFLAHYALKGLPAWLFPAYVGALVTLAQDRDPDWVSKCVLWTTLMTLGLAWNIPGHTLCQRAISRVVRGRGHELRLSVCRHLQHLSLLYHNRESTGKMHARVVRDIDTIENAGNTIAHSVSNALFVLLVTAVTTLLTVPLAGLVFLVLTPVAVIVSASFRRRLESRAESYRASAERLSAAVQDMLQMMPLTRAHGLEETELARAEGRIGDVRDHASRFDTISAIFGSTSWASFMLFQMVFMVAMLSLVMTGHARVGHMVVFQGLFGQLTGSILGVVSNVPAFVQIRAAQASVDEILAAPDVEENRGRLAPADVRGAIALRDVTYTYPGSPTPALQPLTLDIPAGQSVAIVGPSGGGKTTLLSLCLGLLRPTTGLILLDGQDMREIDMRLYRKGVGVVTQAGVFFAGTIHDNIAYGHSSATATAVRNALELANAWAFVDALPEGPATRIGAGGISLSGGQLQRLALARALVRDPRVLVLDEPTSALDAESEIAFREALKRVAATRTTLLVSHSLANARLMSRILVIESGRLTADGPHDRLLAGDHFYARSIARLSA